MYYADLIFGFEEPSSKKLNDDWLSECCQYVRVFPTNSCGTGVAYGARVGLDEEGFPEKPDAAVLLELNLLAARIAYYTDGEHQPRPHFMAVIDGDDEIEIDMASYIPDGKKKEKQKKKKEFKVYMAFARHLFTTRPELFENVSLTHFTRIARKYREEHADEFNEFAAKFA